MDVQFLLELCYCCCYSISYQAVHFVWTGRRPVINTVNGTISPFSIYNIICVTFSDEFGCGNSTNLLPLSKFDRSYQFNANVVTMFMYIFEYFIKSIENTQFLFQKPSVQLYNERSYNYVSLPLRKYNHLLY